MSNTQLSVRLSRKIHRFRQQRTIDDYLQRHNVRKLQLGSGGNPLPGWLNTDINPSDEMILLDVRQPFPFDDASFAYVYSEHSIEHVSYRHGVHCLKECWRVLQPGGKLRIATPNLAFLVALYTREKTDCQSRYLDWSMATFGPGLEVAREAFVINNFFRNWGHEFIYDYAALELALKQAGFVDIRRAEVFESDDPVLRGLESHGRVIPAEFNELETVVAEASKPR